MSFWGWDEDLTEACSLPTKLASCAIVLVSSFFSCLILPANRASWCLILALNHILSMATGTSLLGMSFEEQLITTLDPIPLKICETIPDVSCNADVLWPSPRVCALWVLTHQACAESEATSAPVTVDLSSEWERWRGERGNGRLVLPYPGNGHKHCQSKNEHGAYQSTGQYNDLLTKTSYCGG